MPASSASARDRSRVWHVVKRWLYIVHRWIGIVTCLLFAIWFVSGLVMIYVPFPSLGRAERLAGLPTIAFDRVRSQPGDAARAAEIGMPESIALEMRGDRPVWRVSRWEGNERTVSADDGRLLGLVGRAEAGRIAAVFGRARVLAIERIERDQWTVAGGYDRHRPMWKASMAGAGGRVLYVSSRTGAVVLATDERQRFWNWLGSIPHWIYPTVLRQDNAAWRQVVMWVSGPCIVGAIAGMWIGILRVRLGTRRFSGRRRIPYRGWMVWHHLAGLFGGAALIAWIFSGWLSVDPFRLFASPGVGLAERRAFAGAGPTPVLDLAALKTRAAGARHIDLFWSMGRPLLTAEAPGLSRLLDAGTFAPARLDQARLVDAAHDLVPNASLRSVELLTGPDAYWYEAGGTPILPVLRLRFADRGGSWVHLDPATGRFLGDLDRRRRVYRWAFDFLHKWDLNVLTLNRPLWDGLLWLLSALGLATSVTGIWIGWKRLFPGGSRRRLSTGAVPIRAVESDAEPA